MTLRGRDIFDIPVPRSGIEVGDPEFEWRSAAQWAGYRYERDFQELHGSQQAIIVAHYRTQMQLEAVLAKEQALEARIRAQRNAS